MEILNNLPNDILQKEMEKRRESNHDSEMDHAAEDENGEKENNLVEDSTTDQKDLNHNGVKNDSGTAETNPLEEPDRDIARCDKSPRTAKSLFEVESA